MVNLYVIAFGAPLVVFCIFALFLRQRRGVLAKHFKSEADAFLKFVVAPLVFCYGVILLIVAARFIQYVQTL